MNLEQIMHSTDIPETLATQIVSFNALCNRLEALTEMENITLTNDGAFADTSYSVKKNIILRAFEKQAHIIFAQITEHAPDNTDLLRYFSGKLETIYDRLKTNAALQLNIMGEINRILSLQEAPKSCH